MPEGSVLVLGEGPGVPALSPWGWGGGLFPLPLPGWTPLDGLLLLLASLSICTGRVVTMLASPLAAGLAKC